VAIQAVHLIALRRVGTAYGSVSELPRQGPHQQHKHTIEHDHSHTARAAANAAGPLA
jgi:hypothetical protein